MYLESAHNAADDVAIELYIVRDKMQKERKHIGKECIE